MAKTKYFPMWGKATDSNGLTHYVTVVGMLTQEKTVVTVPTRIKVSEVSMSDVERTLDATLMTEYKTTVRKFQMAKAICDPRDTFDFETGIELCKKRLERGDVIGTQTTTDKTMLNADQCELLVFGEVNHVIKNIDMYIS